MNNTIATDKGNVLPPSGIDSRRVRCVKCGAIFELREAHKCRPSYEQFLASKAQLSGVFGFDPVWMPDFLYDFQKHLLNWGLVKGRAAIFADCGLGKTPIQLAWAENVVRRTNGNVLILTPIAVGHQTVREGTKFGIEAARSTDGTRKTKIVVTNYERLHYFNPNDYEAVVCDESSILKNFDGVTKAAVTEFMRRVKYRLLCTATAAPNDYIELGTSSEALGDLGFMDMLGRFFKKTESTCSRSDEFRSGMYRFRGHAQRDFWRWVCSWSRAIRKPSDFGFDDGAFQLPPLQINEHVISAKTRNPEFLFDLPAMTLQEQRSERSRTIQERCEAAAGLVANTGKSALVWCHLCAEGNLLRKMIPGCEEVSGDDDEDRKEELFNAFESGQLRVLVTKSSIAGFGLNWQHCAHMTYFPSHSFEAWYQSVRRFWRFGQRNTVTADVVCSEGESRVMSNLKRKADACEKMFSQLVELMNNELRIEKRETNTETTEIPLWLQSKK